ncbi:hypothetical protein SAMD00019534_075400, partial [Acytostelium subglobosum LB1]|uniref:hypothetical protein n=1 Tax=Acytostelium subglobosum LB1 TaxID=1410327 RepID=UPI000644958D
NKRILLVSRPSGKATPDNFKLENNSQLSTVLKDGEVLVQVIYLSLDPYLRGRMNEGKASFAGASVPLDSVMIGGTVVKVIDSKLPGYVPGDWVVCNCGWQQYSVTTPKDHDLFVNLGQNPVNPSYALGILGLTGFTAYMGLLDIGNPQPGETVVVGAATGPVGATVGQIAKLKGCRAVGIAGGKEKCDYAKSNGFDDCVDHTDPNFAELIHKACPKGIDVYFESVGGKVFDTVLPLINTKGRIPVCGVISNYNSSEPPKGPDRVPMLESTIHRMRLRMQGYMIYDDYGHRYNEFYEAMSAWVQQGKIKYLEQMIDGLEHAPEALIGLFEGKNFGKLVVKVSSE